MISTTARAKVNLYLHVTGKRPDGYHLLESLVVFPNGGDKITVVRDRDLRLDITGPFSKTIGNTDENLILKAAHLLREEGGVDQGARITLVKNLPVSAGIGGGSADAAASLKLLNQLWKIGFSDFELSDLGLRLGADVPVCLLGKSAIMSGIGEQLEEVGKIPKIVIILVNSGIVMSTFDVFRRLEIQEKTSSQVWTSGASAPEFCEALAAAGNDLQAPAIEMAPEIETVLSEIEGQEGCRLARMSGSGATCFGIFETELAAQRAAQGIQSHHFDWWVQAMTIG